MQYNVEELTEIIYQLEGGFPIVMDMADYLNMIDEMKAYKNILQKVEDEELAQSINYLK